MCEHASPRPAMQVQCAHTTIPCCSTATQGFTGAADSFCECLTRAVTKDVLGRPGMAKTLMLSTQPLE